MGAFVALPYSMANIYCTGQHFVHEGAQFMNKLTDFQDSERQKSVYKYNSFISGAPAYPEQALQCKG